MSNKRELKGDRNQCPTCKKYFNSSAAFSKHRTGTYGVDRRCMTTEEMLETGMALNRDDWWVGSLMSQDVLQAKIGDVNEDSLQNT